MQLAMNRTFVGIESRCPLDEKEDLCVARLRQNVQNMRAISNLKERDPAIQHLSQRLTMLYDSVFSWIATLRGITSHHLGEAKVVLKDEKST